MEEDAWPVLVQFDNGCLKYEERDKVKFSCYRSVHQKIPQRMVVANTGSMTYSGMKQRNQFGMKYYITAISKKTGKIQKIDECHLFTLKAKLPEESRESAAVVAKPSSESATFLEKKDALVEAFGSAKQKRLVSSRKKNETSKDAISEKVASIAVKVEVSPQNFASPAVDSEHGFTVIPPRNADAKVPAAVFNIRDIVSQADRDALRPLAQDMIDGDSPKLRDSAAAKLYPDTVKSLLERLPSDSAAREERACCICYLNMLMAVYKLTYKELKRKDPCPDIPYPLKSSILNSFTIPEKKERRMPRKCRDKLLCYILVLLLILEEYEMDCTRIMKDLKLGVASATKMLRAVGCTVKSSGLKRKSDDLGDPNVPTMIAILNATQPATPKKAVKRPAPADEPLAAASSGGVLPQAASPAYNLSGEPSMNQLATPVRIKQEMDAEYSSTHSPRISPVIIKQEVDY